MLLLSASTVVLTGCLDDELSSTSVFDADSVATKNELDIWLAKNYLEPYNIDFQYRYNDRLSDRSYNVVPAEYNRSKALAILVKHIWLDAYTEVAGQNFLKSYCPRQMQLIGSYEYNSNGERILGTAEGGLKIMLYGVNALDIDNPRIVVDDWYSDHNATPIDLNYGFFHTMHHEFCHILTQQKNYSTDFQTISAGSYHSSDWINIDDTKAAPMGFVSGYASSEYNEDFAETFATYVTMSDKAWNGILEKAGTSGAEIITKKLTMVKEYFRDSWNIDIDSLRQVVLRRSGEALQLNLRDLSKN